jgi:hypothetical protein
VRVPTSSNRQFEELYRVYSFDTISEAYASNTNWELNATNYPWGREYSITIRHWTLAFAFVLFVITPWIRWSKRFSLRTLLIATTLIAVALGLIAYANR